ncbi:MAG: TerB family tellurite resistance protein [Planctomycetota bacterium]
MKSLDEQERMRLLRFVCTFAWTDLKVTEQEQNVVLALCDRLGLDDAERIIVASWLKSPPPIEETDPLDIPAEHREMFVDAVHQMVEADGIAPSEADHLAVFEELLEG